MQNKFKRLLIVSDCIHLYAGNGAVATENHIFRRQMEAIAAYFEHTIICCPFVSYDEHKVITAYGTNTISFTALPNVGGNTWKDKLAIIKTIPAWISAYRKANKVTEVVYMRFPNNLSIPAFFYFTLIGKKKFAAYTGNWPNYVNEPITYRLQKWLLTHWFNGPVWVYLSERTTAKHIFNAKSPSYYLSEWEEESSQVEERMKMLRADDLSHPVFITVGSLTAHKNQQYILDAFLVLRKQGLQFTLYIVGDGVLKNSYADFINKHQLEDCVILTGKKNYIELRALYRQSDFLIQAPLVEGFGKVPVEGLFHGVIPILSESAMSKEMTGNGGFGYVFSVDAVDNLVQLITSVLSLPSQLPPMITAGRDYARSHTLDQWSEHYIHQLNTYFE
jgi:glycosyltransferase involved in cell wall biosynthesis